MKKALLQRRIIKSDNAKKVNPLDLSSDQDLTIGLMNMLVIEEKCSDTELGNMVHDIREELMARIVDKNLDLWEMSMYLLMSAMQLIDKGGQQLECGDKIVAYESFDNAYHFYSLFWGINMGLIDVSDVKTNI